MPEVYIKDEAEGSEFFVKGNLMGKVSIPGSGEWKSLLKFPEHLSDYNAIYNDNEIYSVVPSNSRVLG